MHELERVEEARLAAARALARREHLEQPLADARARVLEPALEVADGRGARLRVLDELGEEVGEGGERDLRAGGAGFGGVRAAGGGGRAGAVAAAGRASSGSARRPARTSCFPLVSLSTTE